MRDEAIALARRIIKLEATVRELERRIIQLERN